MEAGYNHESEKCKASMAVAENHETEMHKSSMVASEICGPKMQR
jgi:hypothetical protein